MKLLTFDDLGHCALMLRGQPSVGREARSQGKVMAALDRHLRTARRLYVTDNLQRFHPNLDPAELSALVRAVYRDRWANAGDAYYVAWSRSKTDDAWRTAAAPRVRGLDRLQRALDQGKGVILWESPFGSRQRMHLALLSQGLRFTQLHGSEHGGSGSWVGQNWIRPMRRRIESRVVPEIIEIQEGRYAYLRMIKSRLAENQVVCMPGLGAKGRRAIALNFLGRKEHFATGVVSLAMSTGAQLIPVYTFEERPGEWSTVFEEPVDLTHDGDREGTQARALKQYVSRLENYVRKHPEQWRRWHAAPNRIGKPGLPAVEVELSQQQGIAND